MRSPSNLLLWLLICIPIVSIGQTPSDSLVFERAVELAENREYEEAEPLLLDIIENASSYNDLQIGKANYYLLNALWMRDSFDSAFLYGDKALGIFQSLEDHYWSGYTHYSLCMYNLIAGSYDVALVQAQSAYNYFEQINDTSMMIWSAGRRGIVFHDIGEYEEGIRVLGDADQLHQQFSGKNADTQAMIWGITAINYDDWGQSAKAVDFYKQILELKDELSSNREMVRTYNNMGNSLMKLGQLEEAEKYFLLNLKANEDANFRYGIATVKTNLGTIAYKKGDFAKARKLLDEAESISYEINDAEKILDVLYQKFLLFEQTNQLQNSLSYLKKYHAVKDSLYSLDKQRQIRFLETRFETKEKEQQIELQLAQLAEQEAELGRNRILLFASIVAILLLIVIGLLWRNRIRKKQQIRLQQTQLQAREAEINATISSQEKERARYARDLHDGFGQMISILNMNLKNLKGSPKPNERQKVFDESSKVIDDMYDELKNICFDLMPQTLIKNGLESALREFTDRVNQTGKLFIELNVFGLNERLAELQEISLYRISQEWINNILKYSDAQKVTLQITKDDDEITLLIEDNGMGFDKDLLRQGNGNGWKNLNTRTNLIHGELELETTIGQKGNTLIVNLPSKPVSKSELTVRQNQHL